MGSDLSINTGDSQLREDLADAMRESPRASGGGSQQRNAAAAVDTTGECMNTNPLAVDDPY